MAGVKGKSGGPRANAGGARPGAGRKPKPEPELTPLPAALTLPAEGGSFDPRPALEQVARGLIEVTPQQYKALTALLPYVHLKKGDVGKKEEVGDKAKQAAGGKYAAAAPPRLAAAGGKKV